MINIIIVVTSVNWKFETFQIIFEIFYFKFRFFGKFSPLEKAIVYHNYSIPCRYINFRNAEIFYIWLFYKKKNFWSKTKIPLDYFGIFTFWNGIFPN
jgi:hypothetical protein